MSLSDSPPDAPGRRLFSLLPAIPGMDASDREVPDEGENPILGQRLRELMDAARCNWLDLEHRAHDQLDEQFARIMTAAKQFVLAGGTALEERLWTGARPAFDGSIVRALGVNARASPGLILLLAPNVGKRRVFLKGGRTIAVSQTLEGNLEAGGPYLVLLECETCLMGRLQVLRGFAQAVMGPVSFMPVRSAFERDVITILLRLQERLDQFGRNCRIERELDQFGCSPVIELQASWHEREIRLRMACRTSLPARTFQPASECQTVGPDDLASGRFAAWIAQQIVG